MTEHKKLLAEKCVELLYRRGVCPTNIELKYKKETNISYISFNVAATMNVISMLIGIDPLAMKLRGGLLASDIIFEVNIYDDVVAIGSEFLDPSTRRGSIFDLLNTINTHNTYSMYNKAYITPQGMQLSSAYNIQTYSFVKEDIKKYNIDFICGIIILLIENMIKDTYEILTGIN